MIIYDNHDFLWWRLWSDYAVCPAPTHDLDCVKVFPNLSYSLRQKCGAISDMSRRFEDIVQRVVTVIHWPHSAQGDLVAALGKDVAVFSGISRVPHSPTTSTSANVIWMGCVWMRWIRIDKNRILGKTPVFPMQRIWFCFHVTSQPKDAVGLSGKSWISEGTSLGMSRVDGVGDARCRWWVWMEGDWCTTKAFHSAVSLGRKGRNLECPTVEIFQ